MIGSNTYYCFGANNEASQDVLQGLTAAGALADEAALFPWSFIEQMIARCSVDGAKLWLNCNPEGPHHQVKTELIDKACEKRILRLHFSMEDNLTLSRRVRDRFRRMFTGVWFKRYILGLWVAAEGSIYDMLDESVHVVDTLPIMHKYWLACDYGPGGVTTFWLLGQGMLSDGQVLDKLYFIDFWRHDVAVKGRALADNEIADKVLAWLPDRIRLERLILPADAYSLMSHFRNLRPHHPELGTLEWADQTSGSVLRGIRDIGMLLATGRLYFSRALQAKGGLNEWQGYVWDPKAQERGEDKPLKLNDHDPDAGRYAVQAASSVWHRWLAR